MHDDSLAWEAQSDQVAFSFSSLMEPLLWPWGEIVLPSELRLKLSELRVVGMSKILTRGSLTAITKRASHICTAQLLALLILDMGEMVPYIGHFFIAYLISWKTLPSPNILPHREHHYCGSLNHHPIFFLPCQLFKGDGRYCNIRKFQECEPIAKPFFL